MFLGAAVKYGSKNEERARQAYVAAQQTNHPGLTCHPIGFVVNECQPFLGASPDGLVQDPNSIPQNGLLEIKCPFVARSGMTAKEYTEHKSSCLSPTFLLKPSHEYFYQIQVAMHVCQLSWCDFCVWAPGFLVINRVNRDDVFLTEVLQKLNTFYFSHLLPALSAESAAFTS